jgi:threonine/homoserine/homoserine lactone efflux protein
LPEFHHPQSDPSGWFAIVVGVGLLWIAFRTVRKARVTASTPSLPKSAQSLMDFVLKGSVVIAFFAGMVMQLISFKSLLVYLAGLKTIIEAQLALLASIFTMLLFITVQLSAMIVPTVVCASFPDHAASFMSTMNRLLMTYSTWLVAAIEAGLGLWLLYRGIVAFMT